MAVIGRGSLQGYKTVLGIAEEVSWGTYVTSTAYFEFSSESMNMVFEEIKPETLNTSRAQRRRLRGNEQVTGSIEAPLNLAEDAIIMLLANAMAGTITTSVISAGTTFGHSISAGDFQNANISSLSIQKNYTGTAAAFVYAGCRVNSLTVKVEQGDIAMISAELIGKSCTFTSDSLTSVTVDVNPAFFPACYFYVAGTTASIIASTNVWDVQNMEFTLNNNLQSDNNARALGSRQLGVLPCGRREVSVKTTMRFDTTTAISLARGDSFMSLCMIFDSGHTISGAGGSTYSMNLTFPRAYANTAEPAVGDAGILQQEIEWTCIQATTTSNEVGCTVNNATASY